MASRRNAAFRAFTSTIVRLDPGTASFMGMAGEPPPDPTSITATAEPGKFFAAANGSSKSLSIASSASSRAVRLIFRFQRKRRS